MTLPACFGTLNLTFFENVQGQITACQTLEELQALVDEVFNQLSLLQSAIQSQINLLTPMAALIISPGNLAEVLTWISNYINDVLTPLIAPLVTAEAQLVLLATQVTTLIATIEERASQLGITITIPTVEVICTL